MISRLFLSLLFIIITQFVSAQTVNGIIKDTNGNPISGVTISNKNSKQATTTKADGSFSIAAKNTDVLLVTAIGFAEQELIVGSNTTFNIAMLTKAVTENDVVVLGTRRVGRVKVATAVPVDVVKVNQVTNPTARMDLTSILNYAAPSFNYNKQSGSDGADHIDLATLRGLGPDQTLVLINGKRRHQTSFVSVFGTRGRGNSGTDLNAIPTSMIDRVEILRDGASAQYGSDAIAGVINLILKKSTNKLSGSIGYAGYLDNKFNPAFAKDLSTQYIHEKKLDGNSLAANMNYGVSVGKKGGFFNFSIDGLSTGKTYRQALDTSNYLTNNNALYINPYRRANGDGSVNMIGTMYNMEIPINTKTTFYSFAGYNHKNGDAYAYTRNFSARPSRFPTTPGGEYIGSGNILKATNDGEIFYNPHIQTKIQDFSLSTGIKGTTSNKWNWDLSNTLGNNKFHFMGDQTFNASLGNGQTHFDDGGFSFLQNTINANFSNEINDKTNFAFGAEIRNEKYSIFAGEEASYKNYSDGTKAGGSQGFPGYQPADVVKATRSVVGFYSDLEYDVTKKLLIDGAVRFENYSDFGATANAKVASRYKAAKNFNIRASASTGFRAPSLQQINFSSTFTNVQGGNISEVKIAPNYSSITKAAGINNLKQEKSINAGAGFTYQPSKDLSFTVDGYYVNIKDRVVLSGQFDGSDPNLDADLRTQMANLNVAYAQFFANAANTSSLGIDFVADYNKKIGNNRYKVLFTSNVQKMKIDKINTPTKLAGSTFLQQTFFSDREQKFLLASAPNVKTALNLEYGNAKYTIGARFTYFGKVSIFGYGQDGLGINPTVPLDNGSGDIADLYNYSGKVVSDLYASKPLNKNWTLFIGADNILNAHPDFGAVKGAKDWSYNTETGGAWDAVQMGINGRRLFARLAFNF